MRRLSLAVLLLISILAVTVNASAALFYGNGINGDFSGSLSYAASDANNAVLTISLTNTSVVANGGYITSVVFNNPFDYITGIPSGIFSDTDFNLIFADNQVKAAPYGYHDIAAALGTNLNAEFVDGGSPQDGIAVNDTETFVFNLTGVNLTSINVDSFLGENDLVVRFRGFEDGTSDKVPAGGNDNPVPEPMTMLLFGPALLGLIGLKKKK